MTQKNINNSQATNTLGANLTAASTTLTVSSSTGDYPGAPFSVNIDDEALLVGSTGSTGSTTWNLTRGIDGTSASTHASGADIDFAVIAEDFGLVKDSTANTYYAQGDIDMDGNTLSGVVGGGPPAGTYRERAEALGPFAHWPLDETSGTTAENQRDLLDIDTTLDGTYAGSPSLNQSGIDPEGTGCPDFDGTDDAIALDGMFAYRETATVTVAGWIQPDDVATNQVVIEFGGAGNGYNVHIGDDGALHAMTWTGNTIRGDVEYSISADTTYHFVAVFGMIGGRVSLYVNGVFVGTDGANMSDTITVDGSAEGGIGASDNDTRFHDNSTASGVGGHFDGKLSQLSWYQRGLGDWEALYLYDATGAATSGPARTLLKTETITSGATFDVTGISQSYDELEVWIEAESADSADQDFLRIQFGDGSIDAASNHYEQYMRWNGDSSGSTDGKATYIRTGPIVKGAGDASSDPAWVVLRIRDYTATDRHKWGSMEGFKSGDSSYYTEGAFSWRNSSDQLERIRIDAEGGNLTGGTIRVFGIKHE